MSTTSGKRNRLIEIQVRSEDLDESNYPVEVWTTLKKKWVWIKTQTGMGSLRSDLTEGVATGYSFRGTFDLSIVQGMRVVYKGQIFEISSVQHDMATRDYSDIVVKLGAGHG